MQDEIYFTMTNGSIFGMDTEKDAIERAKSEVLHVIGDVYVYKAVPLCIVTAPKESTVTYFASEQPAPAPQVDAFKVGDVVEADWARRDIDIQPSDPADWRKATVTKVYKNGYFDVSFDCRPATNYDMRPSEVRRPAPSKPKKFDPKFGDKVACDKDTSDFQHHGEWGVVVCIGSDKEGHYLVNVYGTGERIFSPGNIKPL